MIVTKDEIRDLVAYAESLIEDYKDGDGWSAEPTVEYFGERPHFLMAAGYEESRSILDPQANPMDWGSDDEEDEEWVSAAQDEARNITERYGLHNIYFDFWLEHLYRQRTSGAWYWLEGLSNESPDALLFRGPRADPRRAVSLQDLITTLERLVDVPDPKPRTLWLPRLWTPKLQDEARLHLSGTVSSVLQAI